MVDDTWKTSRDTNMTKTDSAASQLLETSNVCPLAIPEFFSYNRGIRLLANHSLTHNLLNDSFTISSSVPWAHVFLGRRETKWLSKTKWTLLSRPVPIREINQLNMSTCCLFRHYCAWCHWKFYNPKFVKGFIRLNLFKLVISIHSTKHNRRRLWTVNSFPERKWSSAPLEVNSSGWNNSFVRAYA